MCRQMQKLSFFCSILTSIIVLSSIPALADQDAVFKPGTYTAAGQGKEGDVNVEVVFSENEILSVTVGENDETVGIGDAAIDQLPDAIVKNQSLAVDMVSGATLTSGAIIEAVMDCIIQAGADPSLLSAKEETVGSYEEAYTDVLVIGGGGAGMVSAIYAAMQGANVILVEKQGRLGGNTAMARGIFGCSESSYQKENGITATKEDHFTNYMTTYPEADEDMIRLLSENTGAAADWLIENGAEFEAVSGNFTIVPKEHRLGSQVLSICKKLLDEYGVDIRVNTSGKELIVENGIVKGAVVETDENEYTIHSGSVIVATGGFSSNNEMVTKYNPIYEGRGFISSPGNTGDGHIMAEKIGAQLSYMDVMKCNPFLYFDEETNEYTMIGTYVNPGIAVTKEGKRIGNEHANYYFSPSIMALEDKTTYLIYNEAVRGMLEAPDVSDVCYETVEELCEAVGIDVEGLKNTLASYAKSAAEGSDEFGRTIFQDDLSKGPYYAVKLTPAMQGTFGGILINTNAEALDTEGNIIPGLYAAGECAGDGFYGANPVPTDCVFGSIAGKSAALYAEEMNEAA